MIHNLKTPDLKSSRMIKAVIYLNETLNLICPTENFLKDIYKKIAFKTLEDNKYYISTGKITNENLANIFTEDIKRFFSI